MNLEEQIYIRKSCRKYSDEEVDFECIYSFMDNVKALDESIDYHFDILNPDEIKSRTPWSAPYYLAIYSQKKNNYLENIGFVFQQLSLYLQSENIGNCWVGMASPKIQNDDFVITMSFGKSDDLTRDRSRFRRKPLSKISDVEDERLIPAQLAPSAANSQPWYFKSCDEGFDVYQLKANILKRKFLKNLNQIDMGICLAHMYVSHENSFEFYKKPDFESIKDGIYTGSIKI